MLGEIEAVLPTLVAILSLTLFSTKTRWMCYTAVLLSIIAELIPLVINATALIACIACLGAMVLLEVLQAKHVIKPLSSIRQKTPREHIASL